jgi:alginate O-acetyltransferase complex protein AlgI
MLFNSPFFILFFLPLTLLIYRVLQALQCPRAAVRSLIVCSFFFYAWWNPIYVILIAAGIAFNYWVCQKILYAPNKKTYLTLGVCANLGLLAYFKYTDFCIDSLNQFLGLDIPLLNIILPLGISFFIFQKIAFLIDAYRGEIKEVQFEQFTAFVIFFPQLIAGPIPKHNELFDEFHPDNLSKFDAEKFSMGLTAFGIGLFKKTVIADGVALYASPFFQAVEQGYIPTFIDSWSASISYTLQIYFDFSGYSDMAIGLALLFGYRLPLNFFSPYKASNIIDFWRRWHMTLSRFLRDYLYISLGGNRAGHSRQKFNLALTMLLGGLWHGANWTFVVWGLLHALFLCINHLWWELKAMLNWHDRFGWFGTALGRIVTFTCLIFTWVFFRAGSIPDAVHIASTMLGFHGITLNPTHVDMLGPIAKWIGAIPQRADFFWGLPQIGAIAGLMLWVWFAPNTYEYLNSKKAAFETYKLPTSTFRWPNWVYWKVNPLHFVIASAFMGMGAWYSIRGGEFLYFQF